MTKDYITRAALQDADLEDLETIGDGAAMYDHLQGPDNHTHSWVPRAGKDRLVDNVWQHPYECGCGATAWKQKQEGTFKFFGIRRPTPATMIQNDIRATPLPNGALRWFGFDFDRAELPDDALLHRGDRPQWIGDLPGFIHQTRISDARLTIQIDEFELNGDDDGQDTTVLPKTYQVTFDTHGLDHVEVFSCSTWHEVQQMCRRMECQLDESRHERHALCEDEQGNLTTAACSFCERGL